MPEQVIKHTLAFEFDKCETIFLFHDLFLWADSHSFTAVYPLRDPVAAGKVIWRQFEEGEVYYKPGKMKLTSRGVMFFFFK